MHTHTRLLTSLFVALSLTVCFTYAQDTTTSWHEITAATSDLPSVVIVDHEVLRKFTATGKLVTTKRRGNLTVEIRAGDYADTQALQPASIVVRFHQRLIAAASGYRLGSALTANGVTIESWSGSNDCSFIRYELEFRGERMEIINTQRYRSPKCSN